MPNTISPYVSALSNPRQVFFLDARTKRPIPDTITLNLILAQTGQSVRGVTDASLAAITLGAPVPSRRDGALYRGPDRALDLMRSGQRRRIPDVTTLRSLGLIEQSCGWPALSVAKRVSRRRGRKAIGTVRGRRDREPARARERPAGGNRLAI